MEDYQGRENMENSVGKRTRYCPDLIKKKIKMNEECKFERIENIQA